MASNSKFVSHGNVTTNTQSDVVKVQGWVTLSAHLASGSGTCTWQFKGPDGTFRNLYINGTTQCTATATNMWTVNFADMVEVRADFTAGTTPNWDWQIFSNPHNWP